MNKIASLLIIFILCSCSDNDVEPLSNEFQVTIAGTGIDCKLPLIDFLDKDSARINNLTGSTWLRYQALGLDSTLNEIGSTLNIVVRPTQNDDYFACTTLGSGYPWITILNAETTN